MSFFDKAKQALTGAVDKHGDKIAEGIDKTAEAIDQRTGGKHADRLATGAEKAKEALDGLDGRRDDMPRQDTTREGTAREGTTREDHRPGEQQGRHRGETR